MKMKELFDRGEFAVSAEVGPPKGIHVNELVEEAKTYLTGVHAVNVTDNQSSVMRLGSLAMCKVLKDAGMNPIFQLACRDRNRIALESDLPDCGSGDLHCNLRNYAYNSANLQKGSVISGPNFTDHQRESCGCQSGKGFWKTAGRI